MDWWVRLLAAVGVVVVCSLTATAQADDMDIALSRLRIAAEDPAISPSTTCPNLVDMDGSLTARRYCEDADSWRSIMTQLAGSVVPPLLEPAATTGYGGLYVGLEGWISGVDHDSDYWHLGTEGDEESGVEGRNRFPDSTLFWSRVNVRKGFPFGIELGTSLAHMLSSSLWAFGLQVKWALFEGFNHIAILPDIAIRGSVYTVTGDPEFNLTVPTIDVIISKPIVVAHTGTITPFIAGQLAWTFADSELVDLTPETDAFQTCDPDPASPSLACRGNGDDYNNNAVFPKVRTSRYRIGFGVQGRYQALTLTGGFAIDLSKPHASNPEISDSVTGQWTASFGVGLSY